MIRGDVRWVRSGMLSISKSSEHIKILRAGIELVWLGGNELM
jgi:hypothetical protein